MADTGTDTDTDTETATGAAANGDTAADDGRGGERRLGHDAGVARR